MHASPDDLWRAPSPNASNEELSQVYRGSEAEIVVYGHIHRPYVRQLGDLTVANSGSVGLPYDGDPRSSYLLIDDGVVNVRRVEYDFERADHDAAEVAFPLTPWLTQVQRGGRFAPPS
jgi:predicted phosphodiesterase